RKAMEARLAIVVNNQEQLVRKLKGFAKAVKNGESFGQFTSFYTGNVEDISEERDETSLKTVVIEKDFKKIADWWTK
ncbi:hypothetical protein LWS67_25925, partial [Bacillus atrophaeus]|uniref:hypothetical protein n=1 Tax=Bacillus atrophaeus TaxID=1452 RepID=UPI001EFA725B